MIYNTKFKTWPFIAHAPGKLSNNFFWNDVKDYVFNRERIYNVPNDLDIITFNNGYAYNDKEAGIFEKSLLNNNISNFVVLGEQVKNWTNKKKIYLLKEYLNKTKKNYVLVCDSCDVLIIKNIKNIISEFLAYDCEMLFNAEIYPYPSDLPKNILDFESRMKDVKYLNAGLFISKIDYLKYILSNIDINIWTNKHPNSEQIFYKHKYFQEYPKIKVDHSCKLFQGLNRFIDLNFKAVLF